MILSTPAAIVFCMSLATPGIVRELTKEEIKALKTVQKMEAVWHSDVQHFELFKSGEFIIVKTRKKGFTSNVAFPDKSEFSYFIFKKSFFTPIPKEIDFGEIDQYRIWIFYNECAYKYLIAGSLERPKSKP